MFFLCLGKNTIYGQKEDSISKILREASHDTVRCNILSSLIENEYDDNVWPKYNEQLIAITQLHLKNIINPTNKLDTFYFSHLSYCYSNKGLIAHNKGDFNMALKYYNASLDIEKKINNQGNISLVYNNIAGVYSEQKMYALSIDFFKRSLAMRIKSRDNEGIGQSYANLGIGYFEMQDTALAKFYFLKSLTYFNLLNDSARIAFVFNNLASIYRKSHNYKMALEYFNKSLGIQTKINNKKGMCVAMGNISETYILQNKYSEAREYALRALALGKELGFPVHIQTQAHSLYEIESNTGNWQNALKYYQLYIEMRDSTMSEENAKAAIKEQIQFEYDKQKAIDKAVHDKELIVSNEREQKQKIISASITVGLILVILFAIFIFKRLQITNKQKKIIEIQKHLVEEKNKIIEEKQKAVMDSIYYAQRIQKALITSEKYIVKQLNRLKKP